MSRLTNEVSKRLFIKQYVFPESSDSQLIIRASPSGNGFDSKYLKEFQDVIDYPSFTKELNRVESADPGEQNLLRSVRTEEVSI